VSRDMDETVSHFGLCVHSELGLSMVKWEIDDARGYHELGSPLGPRADPDTMRELLLMQGCRSRNVILIRC
jgi:hypothetical protein